MTRTLSTQDFVRLSVPDKQAVIEEAEANGVDLFRIAGLTETPTRVIYTLQQRDADGNMLVGYNDEGEPHVLLESVSFPRIQKALPA